MGRSCSAEVDDDDDGGGGGDDSLQLATTNLTCPSLPGMGVLSRLSVAVIEAGESGYAL